MRTELEQGLLRDRDNPRLWAVYGDWLEGAGDPRALLVSVMLKREALASRAMDEAMAAQAPLRRALTPQSLETLETRGHPRLAPVFRRGFLASAGATQTSDFEALLEHPSAALLDVAILDPEEPELLSAWLTKVQRPLPWRSLEVLTDAPEVELSSLGPHLPWLTSLTLEAPEAQVRFPGSSTLRQVRLRGPTEAQVAALLEAELPALEVVQLLARRGEPRDAPDLDPLVQLLEDRIPRLSRVILEGRPGEATARVVERAKQVVVRTSEPPDATFPIPLQLEPEASFAVLRGPFGAEQLAALTSFGSTVGLTRLVITEGTVRLGGTELTLLRFNGVGEVPLVPRGAIQQLAKKDRALDAVAFTISASNDVASAWSVGPHVAMPEAGAKRRDLVPASRRDESAYSRHELTRAVVGALVGFDPGLDVLEELVASVELGRTHVVIGAAPARGEQLALFTEHAAMPVEEELDEYDRDEDEEDEEEEQASDDDPEFGDHSWRDALVNLPVFVRPEVPVPVDEDDPEDDLDPPSFDAATADEEEVWTQGPIELPEHHDSLPGDRIVEGEELMLNEDALCPRCHQPGETARCSQCLEEVCRACAGLEAGAWEEELPFCCGQCSSPQGLLVAPHPGPLPAGAGRGRN